MHFPWSYRVLTVTVMDAAAELKVGQADKYSTYNGGRPTCLSLHIPSLLLCMCVYSMSYSGYHKDMTKRALGVCLILPGMEAHWPACILLTPVLVFFYQQCTGILIWIHAQ